MSSFEVTVAAEPKYLRITTVGKYVFAELFDFLARVKAEASQANKDHVLIDSRLLEGNMTEAERFQGGQKIAELFGARLKVALLMPPRSITKLGELTAINRGARFLVTDSDVEAMEWLLN
ncbi:MAG TPA: hypothetical protein VGO43_03705 [Pyrinomonadaceae bacterium]|jgi:hypothetical protein|nr:hypothetical protein [Pyrinomonadaceae bacterium]